MPVTYEKDRVEKIIFLVAWELDKVKNHWNFPSSPLFSIVTVRVSRLIEENPMVFYFIELVLRDEEIIR